MWWIFAVVVVALVAMFTVVYRYTHPSNRSVEDAHRDAVYGSDPAADEYRNNPGGLYGSSG